MEPLEMGRDLPTVDLGPARVVTQIAAGWAHTCALDNQGQIICWGANVHGQLGLGDGQGRGTAPEDFIPGLAPVDLGPGLMAQQLTVGGAHSCALLPEGRVKCWGANDFGQLGLGDENARGDEPAEMGEALPYVDLGQNNRAESIAAGGQHTCALLVGGGVKCWGRGSEGQLGLGTDEVLGNGPNEMGDALPVVLHGSATPVSAVALGKNHTCVLSEAGVVRCWGDNAWGQLGQNHGRQIGDDAIELGAALIPTVLSDTAVRLVLGWSHSCAVLRRGRTVCWGENSDGQLGLGDPLPQVGGMERDMESVARSADLGADADVVDVAVGEAHTCALLADRTLRCWGSNASGQLGLGDAADRGRAAEEMGAALSGPILGPQCPQCDVGASCQEPDQCRSLTCSENQRCAFLGCDTPDCPTCWDAVRNGTETDVDCGGEACLACALGQVCAVDLDCDSRICGANDCVSCQDNLRNGTETDVDCGGPNCAPCGLEQACVVHEDCGVGQCVDGQCQ